MVGLDTLRWWLLGMARDYWECALHCTALHCGALEARLEKE